MLKNPKGIAFAVAASQPPTVRSQHGPVHHVLLPEPGTSWTYLVPPFADEVSASLTGDCTDRGCCAGVDCRTPPGAFLRLGPTELVDLWSKEAESAPVHVPIDATRREAFFDVGIEASRRPFVTASCPSGSRFAFTYEPEPSLTHPPVYWFSVVWKPSPPEGAPRAVEMACTVKAAFYGRCPSATSCGVPAEDYLRVKMVVPRADK
jgi:hypothetical protein